MPVAQAWMIGKDAIVESTGLSRDTLHVGIGLLLFLALSAPARARTGSLAAWAVVLAVALANEAADLRNDLILSGAARFGESWHDIAYTMTLPTLLLTWTHLLAALVQIRQVAPQPRHSCRNRIRLTRRGYETA